VSTLDLVAEECVTENISVIREKKTYMIHFTSSNQKFSPGWPGKNEMRLLTITDLQYPQAMDSSRCIVEEVKTTNQTSGLGPVITVYIATVGLGASNYHYQQKIHCFTC